MKKITLLALAILTPIALSGLSPAVYAQTGAQDELNSLRNNLAKERQEFKNAKSQEESEKAAAAKEKVLTKRGAIQARQEAARKTKEEKRKTVLLRLIDVQIKQLENTKDRVAKMPNIKADMKTSLDQKIIAAVSELNAEKAKVQAATTAEELKKLSAEIKDLIKAKQEIVKQIVQAILSSRVSDAVIKAEAQLAKLKTKIAELKARGQNVSQLETLLSDAEAKLGAAKADATKESREDLKKAIDKLREAYQDMKNSAEKINKAE